VSLHGVIEIGDVAIEQLIVDEIPGVFELILGQVVVIESELLRIYDVMTSPSGHYSVYPIFL